MDQDIVDALNDIFDGFEEGPRAQILSWVVNEFHGRALIELCEDDKGRVWKVGATSPGNEMMTVFAMLADAVNGLPVVSVYTYAKVADESTGGSGTVFRRETVWKVAYTQGPIAPEALYDEWHAYFGDAEQVGGGESPAPKPIGNGTSQQASS